MVEFVLVVKSYGKYHGISDDGKRIVRRYDLGDIGLELKRVREMLMMSWKCGNFVEFMGCGWRCKVEDGELVWSRIRDLEVYVDDFGEV